MGVRRALRRGEVWGVRRALRAGSARGGTARKVRRSLRRGAGGAGKGGRILPLRRGAGHFGGIVPRVFCLRRVFFVRSVFVRHDYHCIIMRSVLYLRGGRGSAFRFSAFFVAFAGVKSIFSPARRAGKGEKGKRERKKASNAVSLRAFPGAGLFRASGRASGFRPGDASGRVPPSFEAQVLRRARRLVGHVRRSAESAERRSMAAE